MKRRFTLALCIALAPAIPAFAQDVVQANVDDFIKAEMQKHAFHIKSSLKLSRWLS